MCAVISADWSTSARAVSLASSRARGTSAISRCLEERLLECSSKSASLPRSSRSLGTVGRSGWGGCVPERWPLAHIAESGALGCAPCPVGGTCAAFQRFPPFPLALPLPFPQSAAACGPLHLLQRCFRSKSHQGLPAQPPRFSLKFVQYSRFLGATAAALAAAALAAALAAAPRLRFGVRLRSRMARGVASCAGSCPIAPSILPMRARAADELLVVRMGRMKRCCQNSRMGESGCP